MSAQPVEPTLGEVLDLVIRHYELSELRSTRSVKGSLKNVREYFRDLAASSLTAERWEGYIAFRKAKGTANGSVNRERSATLKGYRLASRRLDEQGRPLVARIPDLLALPEAEPRQRFIDAGEFAAIHRALLTRSDPYARRSPPGLLADLCEFYWLTGWRRREPLRLEWSGINFFRRTITLTAGASKNKQPREIGFNEGSAMEQLLRRRREYTDAVELRVARVVPWVFHREGGEIRNFRKAWDAACRSAGMPEDRLPHVHDFRRSAARDLCESGVDPITACRVVGWKSGSAMLQRYRIVDPATTARALSRVEEFRAERAAARARSAGKPDKVVALQKLRGGV